MPGRLVLLGHPVAHSLSPRFQNAALRRAAIPLRYEPVDVTPEALPALLADLAAAAAAGNVTVPHKRSVAARCVRLTQVAERAGAVNTFWTESEGLVGDNTDVEGFHRAVAALLGREPGAEQRVTVLGAGGAASAVLCAIERWGGASAAVYNRTMAAAHALAARFPSVAHAAALPDALDGATLVVNATSVGMTDRAVPVPVRELPPGAAVLDLVYRPEGTAWVREARAAGHTADDGLTMLVEQGAAAFTRWFGTPPDRAAMWEAVR